VPDPKAGFASGKAEDIVSFSRTFGSESQMFVKKKKQYHAAAGEADFTSGETSGCMSTA